MVTTYNFQLGIHCNHVYLAPFSRYTDLLAKNSKFFIAHFYLPPLEGLALSQI